MMAPQLNGATGVTNFSTWVLVAREHDAAICSSENGQSSLLRVIQRNKAPRQSKEEYQRAFAWQLMSELFRGVRAGSVDGIIIIAAPEMLKQLQRVTLPEIRKMLVAEIPEELPADFPLLPNIANDMPIWSAA